MPGEGGLYPACAVQFPLAGKKEGNAGEHPELGPICVARLICVAPPAVRSSRDARPLTTLLTSMPLSWPFGSIAGICHTLASYLSTHVGPTRTASGGHARAHEAISAPAKTGTEI